MPRSSRQFLIRLGLLLAAGTIVGWLYDRPLTGLLVATLAALVWQLRQLLAFESALRRGNYEDFRYGEGIWQQLFARFSYEKERAERNKRRYRQLLREIRKSTNAMPDAAVILDGNNEILTCNRAAKRLAGLRPKKDRGQRVDNILRDERLKELLALQDQSLSCEIASPVQDGDWLNCRVVPYGADQKLLLLRDITERIRLNRMRRDFVANASHELRSPLTVISGYLDSMADDPAIPEDWAQPVSRMRQQAERMNRIVSELLELSRLESAGKAGTDEVVDVAGLIAGAKKAVPGDARQPEITTEIASDVRLRADGSQVESVINNLLSNAIRHTPPDGRVTVSWRSVGDEAELVVSDTGEGIAAEHIPRLTERFFRVDRGRARDDGGVGLGLAIVKHILNRHDAELRIESERGVGSTFRCRFPAERVVESPPASAGRESRVVGA